MGDARLITQVECEIWVVEDGTCYRFEKGFEGYRDHVLKNLAKRQEEVERMEEERRKKRAEKRAKHVSEEALAKAKQKQAKEAEQEQEKAAEEAKAKAAE